MGNDRNHGVKKCVKFFLYHHPCVIVRELRHEAGQESLELAPDDVANRKRDSAI